MNGLGGGSVSRVGLLHWMVLFARMGNRWCTGSLKRALMMLKSDGSIELSVLPAGIEKVEAISLLAPSS